ncbi:1 TM domain-containing transmembrane protein [Acrasis kona]|uniref:1 TM domain-containing transmembrane protein n=1 Tax=Acrasis kona TaxID=1008807 RepID=A0AAW2ZAZ9_9EUKA
MKRTILIIIGFLLIHDVWSSSGLSGTPVSSVDSSNMVVASGDVVLKYSLPDLHLQASEEYEGNILYSPSSEITDDKISFASNPSNTRSVTISTKDLSVVSEQKEPVIPGDPQFQVDTSNCAKSKNANFCFVYDDKEKKSIVTKTSGESVTESIDLFVSDSTSYYINVDPDIENRLHLTTQNCKSGVCSDMTYFALTMEPLYIVRGPVRLRNTRMNPCLHHKKNCYLRTLLNFHVRNDIVSWIWSEHRYRTKTFVQTFDSLCGAQSKVELGRSLPSSDVCCRSEKKDEPDYKKSESYKKQKLENFVHGVDLEDDDDMIKKEPQYISYKVGPKITKPHKSHKPKHKTSFEYYTFRKGKYESDHYQPFVPVPRKKKEIKPEVHKIDEQHEHIKKEQMFNKQNPNDSHIIKGNSGFVDIPNKTTFEKVKEKPKDSGYASINDNGENVSGSNMARPANSATSIKSYSGIVIAILVVIILI